MAGRWPVLLAVAMVATDGSTQLALEAPQSAPLVTLTIWSLVLSKSMPAAAPLIGTDACELIVTVNVLPTVVLTVFGLRLIVPLLAASAVAGTSTEATRNMAPPDRAASLDRFTWLSLSGIGRRCLTLGAVTSCARALEDADRREQDLDPVRARLRAGADALRQHERGRGSVGPGEDRAARREVHVVVVRGVAGGVDVLVREDVHRVGHVERTRGVGVVDRPASDHVALVGVCGRVADVQVPHRVGVDLAGHV